MSFLNLPEKLHYLGGWTRPVRRPFNFLYTMWKPSHFLTGLEIHTRETTWRTFREGDLIFGVRIRMSDLQNARIDVWGPQGVPSEAVKPLLSRIHKSYGFQDDLRPFVRFVRNNGHESYFKPLLYSRISSPESLFEIAVVSVLLQNATIARTTQMFRTLLVEAGSVVEFDGVRLRAFFAPSSLARIGEAKLRSLCRVGYRAPTLQALGDYFGRTKSSLDSPTRLVESLLEIRGIGPYSAGVIANAAMRDSRATGLDVWNTQLAAGLFGLAPNEVSKERVRDRLSQDYPGFEGLALLYLTEAAYIKAPVDPLAGSTTAARQRSLKQLA